MASREETVKLTSRDREILKDVILTFLGSGEPVSSRSVAKHRRHGLSAASIRNVMADLEELGYLSQPHTSAGRIPTVSAYHLFIDALMGSRRLPATARRQIERSLSQPDQDAEGLMSSASHLLSELSQQIGLVVTPAMGGTTLRSISFIPLTEERVLCVLVSTSGFIENKVIENPASLVRRDLIHVSNYLTDNFGGLTLRQIRDRLLRMMSDERLQVDRLMSNAISLARRALDRGGEPEVFVEGTSAVLSQPELSDIERVRKLLETFADKARLVDLLNQVIEGTGVRVVIGDESDLTSDLDFSLVAAPYGIGERPLGTLGIFGPSRMDYQKVVPLVHYLGDRLSQALEETFAEARGGPERA